MSGACAAGADKVRGIPQCSLKPSLLLRQVLPPKSGLLLFGSSVRRVRGRAALHGIRLLRFGRVAGVQAYMHMGSAYTPIPAK